MASIEELKKRAKSMRSVGNDSSEEEEGIASRVQKLKEKAASASGAIKPTMSADEISKWFEDAYKLSNSVYKHLSNGNVTEDKGYSAQITSFLLKEADVEHYIRSNKSMFEDYDATVSSFSDLVNTLRELRTGVVKSNMVVGLGNQYNGITEKLNKYGTMIANGEYLTKDQLAEYSKLAKDYITVGGKLFTEENGYDQTAIDQFQRSHHSVASNAESVYDFYSQFKDVESYKSWQDFQKRWGHYYSNDDFEEYAAKGAAIENPTFEDAEGWLYAFGHRFGAEDVGNIVTYSRDNYDKLELYETDPETGHDVVGSYLYHNMTDNEVKLYNYLLGKGLTDEAASYLAEVEERLKAEEGKRIAANLTGIDIPVVEDLALILTGLSSGTEQFAQGMKQFFSGDQIDPTVTQYANSYISESLDGYQSYMYGASNTIGNMAPSILVSWFTGGFGAPAALASAAGTTAMGVSAAGNAYGDALAKGYSKGAARTYSVLVGAAEGTLQYLLGGIGKLGGVSSSKLLSKITAIDNSLLRVSAKLGISIGSEILEEEAQLFLEPAFRSIIFGEDYDAPTIDEMVETAVVTALSTGVLEGGGTIAGDVANSRYHESKYGGSQQDLVQQSLEMPDGSLSNKLGQKYQEKLDNGKDLSGHQLSRLVEANDQHFRSEDISKIQSATESRLTELGETGDVSGIAAALAKQAAGEKLSRSERQLISESKYGQRVANELNPDNIRSDGYSTEWAEKLDAERINVEEYSRLVKDAELAGETAETTGSTVDAVTRNEAESALPDAVETETGEPVAVESSEPTAPASDQQMTGKLTGKKSLQVDEKAVSADGQAEIGGNKVVLNGLRENADGSVVVATADDQTADPGDVKYPSMGHALVYENYANIEAVTDNPVLANMAVDTRSLLARAYDPAAGVKAEDYFFGSNLSYQYGFEGIPMNDKTVSENPILSAITKEQRDLAYDLGLKAGKQAADTQDAGIHKAYEKAVEKLGGKGAAAIAKKNPGKVVLRNGIVEDTMKEKQKAAYKLAKTVSKATGVTINIYRGMREHGKYNPATGEIWLNINSNISGSSMMAFTLAHELVHMAKQWKPADFKTFADYLFEQYGKKGVSVDALIREQMTKAKENGYTLNEHEAYEEVIADACQRMLLDSDALQKMAAYKEKNPGTWQKIVNKIREFITGIRNLFKGAEPDSMEAALYKTLDEDAKQFLEKLFVDMVMGAGEHMSTIRNAFGRGTVVEVNADGEFTLAKGNVDGATKFLYNDATWENGGRDTLKAALEAEGFSNEDIKAALTIMDGKHEMVKELAKEFPEQDRINKATITTDLKDGHSVLSALVSNGDYPVNIDLLMVCKKRKAYQRVINRLCETGLIQQATVDALAIAEINKILGKYGFETACLGCFVESRRLRIQEWAETIVKEWNVEVKKRNPNAKAFGFGKGEATLTEDEVMQLVGELEGHVKNDQGNLNLGQGSAVKRMGVLLDKVPSLRKTLAVEDLITPDGLTALRKFDSNLFSMVKSRYGSNSPKFVQEFNPYNHELAQYGKVPKEYDSLREYLYAIGGARMQSFSDFIVENWFDYCQIVADLAARKLPMHTYTKEISLAKLFGLTGIKINMSLIPDIDRSLSKEYAGLTRNEKGELELIWADKDRFKKTGGKSYMQSINFADAIALQNDPRYSANVGTIAVGVSDKHIYMMLDDARIRMVIPYHSSGMNPIFADLMGTSYYKDYTMFQNTTVKQLYNSKGQPVSLKLDKTQTGKLTSGFQFNEVLQELGDARAAAQAYKDWCADASKHTITIKGETYTAELTPKFDSFSWHDNYYKLLEDFNTYDCISEEAAQQGDVQQIYPEDFDQILKGELTAQESHRQKQVENQAFDKAMGEIESYLQNHTKADTVFYAEQHGVNLSAKDKKLGAEDKRKLAGLRKGMKMSMPRKAEKKITLSMTDAERTDILKDKVITAEVYEGQAEDAIKLNKSDLGSGQLGLVKAALIKIADEFDVFTEYNIKDVQVKLEFSKSNIEESVTKKITPEAVAKLMPVLKNAVEYAIGIESHANRYFYDTDIVRFDNLVGGYVEGEYFVPVRFGLKHRRNGDVILYVIVDQQKIPVNKTKAEVVKIAGTQKVQPEISHSAFKIRISDVVPFVNSGDLLRYLPDNMLSEGQKKIKWEAIAATIVRTNKKNDAKYAKYIREGKLRPAAQMVKAAAKDAGYTTNGYHGSRTPGFTVVDKYSWLWFARDEAVATGYGTHDEVDSNGKPHNQKGVYAMWYNLGNNLVVYADGASWGELPVTEDEYPGVYADEETGEITTNAMAEWAARNGYDSITFVDVDDGGLTTVDVVFDPQRNAKSADTITYDDEGNIIPISMRFNQDNNDIRYKTPNSHGMSPRQLLADAFDELVQTPDERELMDRYRKNITKVEEAQERLDELRGEISRLTKAKGDKGEIAALNREASELVDQIDKYDRELLKLEASKPLKDVLARARSAAYQKAEQRSEKNLKEYRQQVSERFSRGVEGRRKTEMRRKIRKTIRDLDKILNRGDKKRNVKEDMKDFVAEALSAAEVLFTDNYTNEDMVRNGFGGELSKKETRYMEEARGILEEMSNLPAGSYESWYERQEIEEKLKSRLAYRMGKLKDAFFRERQRLNKTEVAEVLGKLADAYAELENSEYAYVNGAYQENVHQYLKWLQGEVGGAKVKDMTLSQLESLHKAYTMVLTTVQMANKLFTSDIKMSKEEAANRIMMEVYEAGGEHGLWSKGQISRSQYSWNNTKPIYAAERTGSKTFVQLFKGLFNGQYQWAVDMEEAKAFRLQVAKKYGFKNWDMEKTYKFTSSSGIDFELNLNQIMALYAYAKREQAHEHLLKGGFVFGKNTEVVVTKHGIKRTFLNKSAKAHNISDDIMGEIVSKLTDEQKGFVDEMQDYLSTTMGDKGNEVTMKLYGVKLFMEKFYFPLRSAGQYKEKAKEADLKEQQGHVRIVNAGFTHSTKPEASDPVVLDSFTDVWASHVNEMSLYHSMVLPLEDFRRVYNYASPNMEGQESASVNSFIENAYGDAATGYFDQLFNELNGGTIIDPRENGLKKAIGKFKKGATILSNSVWVQQFSAIGRATAEVDLKYFVGGKIDKHKQSVAWEEVKKYAPVAIIKEMGGFDTHTGLSAKDYLLAEEYGKGERTKGFFTDKQYRSEVTGYLPQKADELTWCAIWEAVKRETKANNPKMDVKSEEFLKKAGERFSEVIEKTQVYDSVLARSANMRSKNALMQIITAFMAEPTTTINMIENALRKGNKKFIARTFGAVTLSIILNNALSSLIYGMRDDDEDETFLEKYTQAFTSGMLDDINPATYYPILKDIWSLFQGYDIERSDMAIYADIADALKKTVVTLAKYDSEMDEEETAEYYSQLGSALMSLLDAGAAYFGVPLKNVRRDLYSYYNTYKTLSGDQSNTWSSFVDAVKGSAKDSTPIVGWLPGESKTDKLYDAIIDGDKEYVDRLKGGYKDQNAYNNAVKKALRDHDPRVKEAAQAQVDGDPSERIRIARLIIADGFPQDAVVMAINAEINALTPDEHSAPAKNVKGDYTAADFAREFANGDHASAKAAREDIIETAQENGKSQKEAEEDFASDARSEFRDLFVAGELSESGAREALKTYCPAKDGPLDDNDIYWIIREWEYEKANGSSDGYKKYNDFHGAVETGRDLVAVISEYTSHGVKKETLASEITSHFKPLYREMSSSKRATFKKYLLNAYVQLGYDRSKKSKDIDKWLED